MDLRKSSLRASVGFLILSALFAVWVVLTGKFGDFEIRVLLTTLSISVASMCAMACGAHIEKTKHIIFGAVGVSFSALSLLMTQIVIWEIVDTTWFWKLCWSCVVISFALAHALLLNLPDLASNRLWLRYFADASVGSLAVLVMYLVWHEHSLGEDYFRLLVVLGIVIALLSILIPIFSKLNGASKVHDDSLLLKNVSNDIYADQAGNYYKLLKVNIEQVN